MHQSCRSAVVLAVVVLFVAACKPGEPPPDIIKTQREALQKSRAVEGQLQQQAEEQKKAAEEAAK